jgi:hypothetical protein
MRLEAMQLAETPATLENEAVAVGLMMAAAAIAAVVEAASPTK